MAAKKKTTTKKKIEVQPIIQTEKDLESLILDWINTHPKGFAFQINTVGIYDPVKKVYRNPGKYTLKGTSDILGIWYEKPLAIEVKKPGGQVSVEQKAFINKYKQRGGIAFVAYGLEDVKKHLEFFARHGFCIVS